MSLEIAFHESKHPQFLFSSKSQLRATTKAADTKTAALTIAVFIYGELLLDLFLLFNVISVKFFPSGALPVVGVIVCHLLNYKIKLFINFKIINKLLLIVNKIICLFMQINQIFFVRYINTFLMSGSFINESDAKLITFFCFAMMPLE